MTNSSRERVGLIIGSIIALSVFALGLFALGQFVVNGRIVHLAQAFVPVVFGGWALRLLVGAWCARVRGSRPRHP